MIIHILPTGSFSLRHSVFLSVSPRRLGSNDLIDVGEASYSKTHTDSHQLIPIQAIIVNYLNMQLREVALRPLKKDEGGQKSFASQEVLPDLGFPPWR